MFVRVSGSYSIVSIKKLRRYLLRTKMSTDRNAHSLQVSIDEPENSWSDVSRAPTPPPHMDEIDLEDKRQIQVSAKIFLPKLPTDKTKEKISERCYMLSRFT